MQRCRARLAKILCTALKRGSLPTNAPHDQRRAQPATLDDGVDLAQIVDEDVNDLPKRSFAMQGLLNIIDASRALIEFARPKSQSAGIRS